MNECNIVGCTTKTKSAEYCSQHAAEIKRKERMAVGRYILGGECKKCGSTKKLEFDHIYPETKLFNISECSAKTWDNVLLELKKCQLLCRPCHIEKSINERKPQTWSTKQTGDMDIDLDAINRIKF